MPVFAERAAGRLDGERSPTGTTSAAWRPARSPPRRTRSSRRGCGCPPSSWSTRARRSRSVTRIMQANSRLPDFLARRPVGRDRRRPRSARAGSRELVARYGVDTFLDRARAPARPRRAGRAARARLAPARHVLARRGAGQRRRLPRRGGALGRRAWSSTCATTPTRTRARERLARRRRDRRADGADEPASAPARRRQRRALPAADGAHAPGLGLRPARAGRDGRLLRGADPAVRPDPALPRAAPRGTPARRAGSPRSAARSSAAATRTRAGTSRSSSRRWAAGARPPSGTG